MSDITIPDEITPEQLEALRADAAARHETEATNAQLAKQLLFARAGITDVTTGPARYLFAGFEGEDLDELRREAISVGLLDASGNPVRKGADETDHQQQAFRDALAGGAPAGAIDPPAKHPIDRLYEEFHASNGRREDKQIAFLGGMYEAARTGDSRVLFAEADYVKAREAEGRKMRSRAT